MGNGECLSCFSCCASPVHAMGVAMSDESGYRCTMCARCTCRDAEGEGKVVFLLFFSFLPVVEDGRVTHNVLELCGQSVVYVTQVARVECSYVQFLPCVRCVRSHRPDENKARGRVQSTGKGTVHRLEGCRLTYCCTHWYVQKVKYRHSAIAAIIISLGLASS